MLIYGPRDRQARAQDDAARRRHAGGRLPDARAARRLRLRARAAACSASSWARAPASRCGSSGALGIFPDGQTYAFAFGVFYGLMELIPYVGPVLGALPPIIVALAQDPLTAVWVALHVPRAAAVRGPHRRAERLRALAAPQPAARDLRAAARRPDLRLRRSARRAAARGDPARDGRLPQGPPRLRAVGHPVAAHRRAGARAAAAARGRRARGPARRRAEARAEANGEAEAEPPEPASEAAPPVGR